MKGNIFTMELIEASIEDIDLVGGKNASLGEMLQKITPLGVNIPDGFIVTSSAYFQFIKDNGLEQQIKNIVEQANIDQLKALSSCGNQIRQLIQNGQFSSQMETEIIGAYRKLIGDNEDKLGVAVRSSATAEDLPDASFAGQQDTFLNIRGTGKLLVAIKNCFASLFTDRAISYRESFDFGHFNIGLSVCIQKMVRSDIGVSGVAFSIDTESGFKDAVIINGSYGLGEMIVQGAINPDEFIVYKPLLKKGFAAIIEKKLGKKQEQMVYGVQQGKAVEVIRTPVKDAKRFCLTDRQILQLSNWVMMIEAYYTKLKGHWCPMDVEWAVDGITGELFIVQARPETIHSRNKVDYITEYQINDTERLQKIILTGVAVGDKIASGRVHNLVGLKNTLFMKSIFYQEILW